MSGVDANPSPKSEEGQEDVFPWCKQKEERKLFLYSDSPSYFGVSIFFCFF